jgi:hypothetical protein
MKQHELAWIRRFGRPPAVVGFVLVWLLAAAAPAAAECTSLDPWPSFRATVRAAERVIVGEVVEDRDPNSSGLLSRFGLRLDTVLRGPGTVGEIIEIAYLKSGRPTNVCADSHLWVLPGDVIALALDAPGSDGRTLTNSVAWLEGSPDTMQRGVGQITLDELRTLVALPQTDADPMTRRARAEPPAILVIGSVGCLAMLLCFAHLRPRVR